MRETSGEANPIAMPVVTPRSGSLDIKALVIEESTEAGGDRNRSWLCM